MTRNTHQIELNGEYLMSCLTLNQKCEGCLDVFTSYPVYSQIWLRFIMEDHHFSYITKMTKRHELQDDKMGGIIKGMFLGKWQSKMFDLK